jgi:hypothetical protein
VAGKLSALFALVGEISDFLDSGLESGAGENVPQRSEVAIGGPVHNAVVEVQRFYGGKLPSGIPRQAWVQLTEARDNGVKDREWNRISEHCGEAIVAWAKSELVAAIQRLDPADLADEFSDKRHLELLKERQYREIAKQLVPGFEAPRDIPKMAAYLCHAMHLQPSEFQKLDASGRLAFATMALERAKEAGTLPASTDAPTGLNPKQAEAYTIIRNEGPIAGKLLARRLKVKGDSLRKHVLSALKKHGLRNDRDGDGYYFGKKRNRAQ